MKNKAIISILIIIIICFLICAKLMQSYYDERIDITVVNQITSSVERYKDNANMLKKLPHTYNFAVVNKKGQVLHSNKALKEGSFTRLVNDAIRDHETVVYYSGGAIIVYTNEFMQSQKEAVIMTLGVTLALICMILIGLHVYLRRRVVKPFKKLEDFASSVAAGQLDLPLPMDRLNTFGAFTESFDLMRTELHKAQQTAASLEKAKNEMVASLSHDIKTPLASIIAVSDMLLLTEKAELKRKKISGIAKKAEEIDRLMTDLFQTTLEDLSELSVTTENISSVRLWTLIEDADVLKKVSFVTDPPSCLVNIDPLRISQVFTNIISNAYKYAETSIEVSTKLNDDYLEVRFRDFGTSVKKDEVALLANKFFRGENAQGEQGSGLGLYISQLLLDRMKGRLELIRDQDGFHAIVQLPLSK